MVRLQIVGGGKMGEALIGGLLERGWCEPAEVRIVEKLAPRRAELAAKFAGVVIDVDIVGADTIIAVKPDAVDDVCRALAAARCARALSIAAGIRLARLEANLAPNTAVIRAMPNTPALVGAGASAIAAGRAARAHDIAWARAILQAVGDVHVVDENDLDAVTGLSGSGPAYVFLFAEAMIAAGEHAGLSHELSVALTEQTLFGAAKLLKESSETPATLRRNVTSPGGTTAAGLAVFDEADFSGLVASVVRAATARSRELSGA